MTAIKTLCDSVFIKPVGAGETTHNWTESERPWWTSEANFKQ